MPKKLSHYDRTGRARMVDVSAKTVTKREAEASAFVVLKPAVLKALPQNPKGRSTGGGAVGGNHGCQAHLRVDSDVPSAAALAR